MKKNLFTLFIISALILTGCTRVVPSIAEVTDSTPTAIGETPNTTMNHTEPAVEYTVWADREEITLEQAISESNCLVRAKYSGCKEYENYADFLFEPLEVYKGAVDGLIDGVFYVRTDIGEEDGGLSFADGEYILPLKYVNSVYFDYPVYNVIGHITIPCEDTGAVARIMCGDTSYNAPAELADAAAIRTLAQNTEDTSELMFEDYIHSTSLPDITEGSDYIVKAKVTREPFDVNSGRGLFTCELTACYKGEMPQTFQCLFFTDSVEVGGEYYFFLTKLPSSTTYKISSKNSIYSADDSSVAQALEDSGIM